jgi:hypothetical protein
VSAAAIHEDLQRLAGLHGHADVAASLVHLVGNLARRSTRGSREGSAAEERLAPPLPGAWSVAMRDALGELTKAHTPSDVLDACIAWLSGYADRGALARAVDEAGVTYVVRVHINGHFAALHGGGTAWIRQQLTFHAALRNPASAEVLSVEEEGVDAY